MSLFDEEAKAYFLAAGYAVATIDVRAPICWPAPCNTVSCGTPSCESRSRVFQAQLSVQIPSPGRHPAAGRLCSPLRVPSYTPASSAGTLLPTATSVCGSADVATGAGPLPVGARNRGIRRAVADALGLRRKEGHGAGARLDRQPALEQRPGEHSRLHTHLLYS